MGGGAEAEDIEQQTFVISAPTMGDEPVLGPPAMGQGCLAVAGPVPVGSLVEMVGDLPDFGLIGSVVVEISGHGQGAREQECRVDGRQFALPNAAPGLYVEEMVEEALVARGVRLGPLRAFQ